MDANEINLLYPDWGCEFFRNIRTHGKIERNNKAIHVLLCHWGQTLRAQYEYGTGFKAGTASFRSDPQKFNLACFLISLCLDEEEEELLMMKYVFNLTIADSISELNKQQSPISKQTLGRKLESIRSKLTGCLILYEKMIGAGLIPNLEK